MQKIESSFFTILIPDKGYKIVNKTNGQSYQKIYLGINDSIDNYTEVIDEKYINMDYVVELNDVKDSFDSFNEQTDSIIDSILLGMDELLQTLEPFLEFMPMTLDIRQERKDPLSKFVTLYALMIQRGLKTIDDIPIRFKEDVQNIL